MAGLYNVISCGAMVVRFSGQPDSVSGC